MRNFQNQFVPHVRTQAILQDRWWSLAHQRVSRTVFPSTL